MITLMFHSIATASIEINGSHWNGLDLERTLSGAIMLPYFRNMLSECLC